MAHFLPPEHVRQVNKLECPNPRIKPEKKDLAARGLFNIGTGWSVKTTHLVETKEFVMNILRNLVLRLNYKQDLDLGGLTLYHSMTQ